MSGRAGAISDVQLCSIQHKQILRHSKTRIMYGAPEVPQYTQVNVFQEKNIKFFMKKTAHFFSEKTQTFF